MRLAAHETKFRDERKYDMQETDGNGIVTGEFVRNAKHLYRTALRYTKMMKKENWPEAIRHYRLLHKALTRFNYGVDPLAEGGTK